MMKILAIADNESKNLWDFYQPGKLDGIDLIISCGDLNPHYLSFLATFTHAPILYVHGNHDAKYLNIPPDGCISIEDTIYVHEGVRILGLGGSMRYKDGPFMYDEKEMRSRVRKLWFKLRKHKGFDILVAHSPAREVGDGEDLPHRGFYVFRELLEKYRPKYFLHGHVHTTYGRQYKRLNAYEDTLIINPYETYLFEFETEYDEKIESTKIQVEKDKVERERVRKVLEERALKEKLEKENQENKN